MRGLGLLVAGCVAVSSVPAVFGQAPVHTLNLVIVEGDGVINNIRQRTAREPIVQVEDENHKPVAEEHLPMALIASPSRRIPQAVRQPAESI
jgi:hypothetical protein